MKEIKPHHIDTFNNGAFIPNMFLLDGNPTKCITDVTISVDYDIDIKKLVKELEKLSFYILFNKINYVKRDIEQTSERGWVNPIDSLPEYLANEQGTCVIEFHAFYEGSNDSNIVICYIDSYDAKDVTSLLLKYKKKKGENRHNISFIIKNNRGLSLIEKPIRKENIPLENYDFTFSYEKLLKSCNSPDGGLILFSGIPGTGKSWFIRHLISVVNKKFVYIPTNTASILSDEGFLPFAIENLKDCILVIEDAETVLIDRQKDMNSAASTILNVTDGILGEILNAKILATINVAENIDHALLRKGRLLAKVNFDKLPTDKANIVLKRLKKKNVVEEPTILADLYTMGEDNGGENRKERKIGFRVK
jgi:hypothetical protein